MREALNAHVDLKARSASLSEAQIMANLSPGDDPEGMFFPDTYVSPKVRRSRRAGARPPRMKNNSSRLGRTRPEFADDRSVRSAYPRFTRRKRRPPRG